MPFTVMAQFNTAVINRDIGTNEYGTGNINNYVSGTPIWYITWDDTYLYASIQNANENEAGIIYLDIDPIIPVNGGNAANGSNVGYQFDGLGAPNLPFRANTILYFRNNYREIRRFDGSSWVLIYSGIGGLGGTTSDYTNNDYSSTNRGNADATDDDRELRVSWCTITGGSSGCRPASFNWLGYIAYTNGIYGQVPVENPTGNQAANAVLNQVRYLTITSTANGIATSPVSRNCYTHPIGVTNNAFGTIPVWDFTMNSSGNQISRGTTGGNWTIIGTLVVGAGTVFFGNAAPFGTTFVGNLDIRGGSLNMDQTTQPMNVTSNVALSSGTLFLSGAAGGDLQMAGDFTKSGGDFTHNNRSLTFNGTTLQTITSNSTLIIPFITINNAANVRLGTSTGLTLTNTLTFTNGKLDINGNNITLGGSTVGVTNARYVVTSNGTNTARVTRSLTAGTPFTFPVGTSANYMPVTLNPTVSEAFNVRAYDPPTADGIPGSGVNFIPGKLSNMVQAIWNIDRVVTSTNNVEVTLQWQQVQEGTNFQSYPNEGIGISRFISGYSWSNAIRSSGTNGTTNIVTATFNTFSPFGVGEINKPLPSTFIDFAAAKEIDKVKINWAAQETGNLDYYEIERSSNGLNFLPMQRVEKNNNSQYVRYDVNPLNGFNYYRLLAVGKNGGKKYSQTVRVNVNNKKGALIVISNSSTISVRMVGVEKGTYQLQIISANGTLIYNKTISNNETDQLQTINLQTPVSKGVYQLVLRGGAETYTQSFVH